MFTIDPELKFPARALISAARRAANNKQGWSGNTVLKPLSARWGWRYAGSYPMIVVSVFSPRQTLLVSMAAPSAGRQTVMVTGSGGT